MGRSERSLAASPATALAEFFDCEKGLKDARCYIVGHAATSVSHVGLMLLGIFLLNAQSLQGSLMLMINIGIIPTALMFLTSVLFRRTGSTQLSTFGGLAPICQSLPFSSLPSVLAGGELVVNPQIAVTE